MNPRVRKVAALPEYRLKLTFDNGETGIYDCTSWLDFGVFRELADEAYFGRVRAFNGTVVWPHEQDICPDTLYMDSVREHKVKPAANREPVLTGRREAMAVREKRGHYVTRQPRKRKKSRACST